MPRGLFFTVLLFFTIGIAWSQPTEKGTITNKDQSILALASSPDGMSLLSGGDDNKIHVWSTENYNLDFTFSGHNDWVTSLAFSTPENDNRQYLASGAKDGNIIVYEFDKRSMYYQTKSNTKTIYDLVFLDQFSLLVAVSGDGNVTFIDLDAKNAQDLKISDVPILTVAYLESKRMLLIGDAEGNIKMIDPVSRSIEKIIPDRSDFLRSISIVGENIIAVGDDKVIRVRNSEGNPQNELEKAHKKWIQISKSVGDDSHFVTGGHDGIISLWKVEGLERVFDVKESGTFASGVAFDNELKTMYTAGYGSSGITIWDISYLGLKKKEAVPATTAFTASSRQSTQSNSGFTAQAEGIYVVQPYYGKGDVFYCIEDEAIIRGFVNVKDGVKEFKIINDKTSETLRIRIEDDNSFEFTTKLAYLDNNFQLRLTTSQGEIFNKSIKYHRIFDKSNPEKLALLSRNGRDYALIIATNDYSEMGNLTNPIFDANAIANELESNYGFEVEKILNPPLDEIKLKIKEYTKRMFADEDQLFIFIAGHGEYDAFFKEGYIVATDSKANDEARSSYLPHSTLRTYINNIPCRHILLTMDVCFGGTFDPIVAKRGNESAEAAARKVQLIKRKLNYLTRLYVTSGGKEYVPDGRPGHHSPFARKFLESLRTYGGTDEILTTKDIFSNLELLSPEPRFGDFGDNEPGSDFIFIYK